MEYLLHLLILVGVYVMLSQSLSLSAGFGGMVSLAHAGFYGAGAYTVALLAVRCGAFYRAWHPDGMPFMERGGVCHPDPVPDRASAGVQREAAEEGGGVRDGRVILPKPARRNSSNLQD